ncbi:NAD(P)(+)--arginine ADP-ribosyltransferase 2-like [Phasianus colchicus]|uniref:NAD(P)(+)--arginine ADP-ribosyltransferase n=1 Tax=Phasianus colchicus TaxID=9054 RepID=A0A669QZB7_PHACC|nr:NAD(P)(+)--arginine ADP-ribosyltransferase 2-like [Phasianus colchicus]
MELLALRWVLLSTLLSTSASSSALREGDPKDPEEIEMDMAPDSFDDQYEGCEVKMWAKLQKVNLSEFDTNDNYANTWKRASAEWQERCGCPTQCPKLRQELAIAVLAYTARGGMYRKFNAATRQGGQNHQHYLNSYDFKTLHFVLTLALQDLWKSDPNECYKVFRGVKGIRFTTEEGQTVRFGQFTSASLKKEVAEKFGKDTVFVINTCYGAPIKQFSFFKYQDEILIPPFEVFEVIKISNANGSNQIELLSKEKKSNHNCELLKCQGRQWGRGHQEVGLGLSPGLALHSLGCSNCSWGGSGHRERDPIPAAL